MRIITLYKLPKLLHFLLDLEALYWQAFISIVFFLLYEILLKKSQFMPLLESICLVYEPTTILKIRLQFKDEKKTCKKTKLMEPRRATKKSLFA